MSKDPAVLFYTSDFISGTYTMTDESVGKYIRLLCLQHQKGRLTEEDMLYICSTYVKDVYAKFLKDEKGLYYNLRMEIETVKRQNYSKSRQQNILSRYNKKNNPKSTYVEHMENENENINSNIKGDIQGEKEVRYNPEVSKLIHETAKKLRGKDEK